MFSQGATRDSTDQTLLVFRKKGKQLLLREDREGGEEDGHPRHV